MIKKDLKRPKAETVTIKGTVTKDQREIIQKLIGLLGSNEQDVIGKILTLWLYNEGFLKKTRSSNKIEEIKKRGKND
jgi:RNA-binding protein YhbY